MDRLSPLDDTFISIERDQLPMHIGSLLVIEGPMPDMPTILARMEGRLDRLPRYRQVVRAVPLQLGLPIWADDPHFHLQFHVRHTAVPQPGGAEELRALAGRLLSLRLDLDRPLWEMWFIEGLEQGRFAILNKVHHAMVDGLSGSDIMEVLLDDTPDVSEAEASTWTPQQAPSSMELLTGGLADSVRNPLRRLGHLAADLKVPTDAVQKAAAALVGTAVFGQRMAHVEDHLTGQPGPHRRWDWAIGDLEEVKRIKDHLGGTVNDVILAAITSGYRAFLLGRGEVLSEDSIVRSLVPVSTRPPGTPTGGNQVAAMLADLPVGIADSEARYRTVSAGLSDLKGSGLVEGIDALIENAVFVPPMLLAAAGRIAARTPQPSVSTVTTNVPGPQRQLYFMGRPMRHMFPYVPLGMNMLVTVAIMSYNGEIACGISADYDKVPDVHVVAQGIEDGLAELGAIADRQ